MFLPTVALVLLLFLSFANPVLANPVLPEWIFDADPPTVTLTDLLSRSNNLYFNVQAQDNMTLPQDLKVDLSIDSNPRAGNRLCPETIPVSALPCYLNQPSKDVAIQGDQTYQVPIQTEIRVISARVRQDRAGNLGEWSSLYLLVASCQSSPAGTTTVNQKVTWNATASGGDNTDYTYLWSFPNDAQLDLNYSTNTNSQSATVRYQTPGLKKASVIVGTISRQVPSFTAECPALTVNTGPTLRPWIKISGDVHSNTRIDIPGTPGR